MEKNTKSNKSESKRVKTKTSPMQDGFLKAAINEVLHKGFWDVLHNTYIRLSSPLNENVSKEQLQKRLSELIKNGDLQTAENDSLLKAIIKNQKDHNNQQKEDNSSSKNKNDNNEGTEMKNKSTSEKKVTPGKQHNTTTSKKQDIKTSPEKRFTKVTPKKQHIESTPKKRSQENMDIREFKTGKKIKIDDLPDESTPPIWPNDDLPLPDPWLISSNEFHTVPRPHFLRSPGKRKPWTEEETNFLIKAVKKHGKSWADIVVMYGSHFNRRTQTNLKDKYRWLVKKEFVKDVNS